MLLLKVKKIIVYLIPLIIFTPFFSCKNIENSKKYNEILILNSNWKVLIGSAPDFVSNDWINTNNWIDMDYNTPWTKMDTKFKEQVVSYKVDIDINFKYDELYLFPGEGYSAQRVFIKNTKGNFQKVYANVTDKDFNSFKPGIIRDFLYPLPELPQKTTMIIQISNGPAYHGKLDTPPIIGTFNKTTRYFNFILFKDALTAGIFLFVALLNMSFWQKEKSKTEYLYIGILFIIMTIRVLDTFTLPYIFFSSLKVWWFWRIGWITMFLIMITWILISLKLFKFMPKRISKVVLIIVSVILIVSLFSDYIMGRVGYFVRINIGIILVVITIYSTVREFIESKDFRKHIGLWSIIVSITALIDILFQTFGRNINSLNVGLIILGLYLIRYHNNAYVHALNDVEKKVKQRTNELKILNNKLKIEATTDSLTKLPNRNALYPRFEQEQQYIKNDNKLCMAIVDADYFKKINDTYGHDIGDKVLINLATILKDNLRDIDMVSRFGGEEFIILMAGSDASGLFNKLNKIRNITSNNTYIHNGFNIQFTISIGATLVLKDEDISSALKRADNALYIAKESGRNMVKVTNNKIRI